MDSSIIAALDIGTTLTRVVVARQQEFDRWEVIGVGVSPTQGVIQGTIHNIAQAALSVREAVKIAEEASDTEIHQVRVGVGAAQVRSMFAQGMVIREDSQQEISSQDLRKLDEEIYRQIIPDGWEMVNCLPIQYQIDHEEGIHDPIGRVGVRLEGEYLVLAAESRAMENLRRTLEKADLAVDECLVTSVASAQPVLTEEERRAGVCVVDIGGGATRLSVYIDGGLQYFSSFPVGGNLFTEDLAKGCGITLSKAELLKTKYGSAWVEDASSQDYIAVQCLPHRKAQEISRKNMAHILEARLLDILEWVHTILIVGGYEDQLMAGLVFTGGGAQLPGIEKLATIVCQQQIQIGYPNQSVQSHKPGKCNPSCPSLAGLFGIMMGGNTLGLLPGWSSDEPRPTVNLQQLSQLGRENMTYWWQKARDLLLDTEGDYVFEVSK